MRTRKLLSGLAIAVAAILTIGCGKVETPEPKLEARGIDDIIADIESDNGLKVELAALELTGGNQSAADLRKALPALQAATKKKWGHPRIAMSLNQALRAAKQAKP